MSGMYDNTNTGAIFVNKRKSSDKQPTHTGSINVEGVEYWVSAWVKAKKDSPGERYFSLALTKKERQGSGDAKSAPASKPSSTTSPTDYDDDIPF